jgi:hypothetical protein
MIGNLFAGKCMARWLLLGVSTQAHDFFVRLRERSRQSQISFTYLFL